MPAPNQIRFEDVGIKIFVDDREWGPLAATDFQADPIMNHDSQKHQGENTPHMDSDYGGWQGSFTFDHRGRYKNPMQPFFDYLEGVRSRSNTGRVRILVQTRDPETGNFIALRFDRCQITTGIRSGGGQRVTSPFAFQAEDCTPIN